MAPQTLILNRLLPASNFFVISYWKKNKGKGFGFSLTYSGDKTVVAILLSIKNPIFNEY